MGLLDWLNFKTGQAVFNVVDKNFLDTREIEVFSKKIISLGNASMTSFGAVVMRYNSSYPGCCGHQMFNGFAVQIADICRLTLFVSNT